MIFIRQGFKLHFLIMHFIWAENLYYNENIVLNTFGFEQNVLHFTDANLHLTLFGNLLHFE